MTNRKRFSLELLATMLCLCITAIFAGCASQPAATTQGVQASSLTPQEQRLNAIIEVRQAYAAAENIVTSLTVAKAIDVPTATKVRAGFKLGRNLLETADAMLTTSSDVQWSAAIGGVWNALDSAVSLYSPGAKPSAARRS